MNYIRSKTSRQSFPLSVAVEGRSWVLTALVESTIALWMILLRDERTGFLQSRVCVGGPWAQELLVYFFFMTVGALSAGFAIGVLSLNFRPPNLDDWRLRSCRSMFALLTIDLLAIDHVAFVVLSLKDLLYNDHHDNTGNFVAEAFIVTIGIGCTIAFNVLYVREFGFFSFCRGNEYGDQLVEKAQEWLRSKNDLPAANVAEASSRTEVVLGSEVDRDQSQRSSMGMLSESSSSLNEAQSSIRRNNTLSSEQSLQRWDTKKLIELGSIKLSQQKSLHNNNNSDRKFESIVEDKKLPDATPRLRRRLPSAPDISKIVTKLLQSEEMTLFSHIRFNRGCIRELWNSAREEPGRFKYAVWIKSAFFTSVIVLLYTCIRSMSIIFSLVDGYKDNRSEFQDNMRELDSCLVDSDWVASENSTTRRIAIKLYLVVDAVIVDYKWTALVGYPIGTAVGLYGLVAVLVQHKRMSLAVSDRLREFQTSIFGQSSTNHPWLEFQNKYPILEACFFLAILSSTAVLQLHIVGAAISIILGLIVNVMELQILLELFGYYFLAYALMFLIDVVVMRILKSSVITEDGNGIRHPRWFNFFMVVLSMVHLVIGILYALWRVLYLIVTTVFVLNRLDVCLFTTGKSLDNGHNAFMSMLVLTVLIQQDSEKSIDQMETNSKEQTI
eukprot:g3908.t1